MPLLTRFWKVTRKHLCQNLLFNEVTGFAWNFIKKGTLAQTFFCEFCKILKVAFSLSKTICVICLIESPLKMMKNDFYFVLKVLFRFKIFKGYLRYKMLTSQNVSSEAQIKIFLFRRKIIFRYQDIQIFVFLTVPWFTKSVRSQWVLVHETRCIFKYILWTTIHEVIKLGQLIDIGKGNNLQ